LNHKKLLLLIFIPLFLSLVTSNVNASETSKIYTLADSRVKENEPNANYGDNDILGARCNAVHERSFLRFSLFSIPSGSTINSAKLYLRTEHTDGGGLIAVFFVTDDSWGEMTITWNNQPSYSTLLDSKMVTNEYTWYSWTVTTQVITEFSGDKTISFMLANSTTSVPELTEYDSKDGQSGMCPYLDITYTLPEGQPPSLPPPEKPPESNKVIFTEIPQRIGYSLHIPLFAGQLLATGILFSIFCFPVFLLTKRGIAHVSAILFVLGFAVVIGWCPIWILLLVGVVFALLIKNDIISISEK
jgi:hypothetical protein